MQLPAKPCLDQSRNLVRDPQNGKVQYTTILDFEDRLHAVAFREGAIAALIKREPKALTIQQETEECPPPFV